MTAMRTLSTTQAKKMDQLATMPWLKFDYTNYEQSEFRAANSPIARLAFVELTMRSIRTGFKLPKNDAALATWAGITKAQWAKVKDVVVAQFKDADDHYVCTGIADLYGEYVGRDESQVADEAPKSKVAERVRRHREKQRNAQNNADVTPSVTPVTLDVTHVTPTCNADVTLDAVTSVTFGGIKGGDLDQDLDLENNKHTQSACEDFAPDLAGLNAKLKLAGAEPITQEQLNQTLVTFIPHYETHHLTDNQRMGKLVQWIKKDQADAAKASPRPTKPRQTAQQPTYGNVNDNWGNPPPPDLDAPVELTEEYKRAMAKLRVKS